MKKIRFKSIQSQMLLTLIPIMCIALFLICMFSYHFAKQKLNNEITKNATYLLQTVFENISDQLTTHSLMVINLADTAAHLGSDFTINQSQALQEKQLTRSQITYGLGVFYAENQYKQGVKYHSMYAYREGNQIKSTTEYDDPTYDYLSQPWYTESITPSKEIHYSEPFFDSTLNVTMITAGQPFYSTDQTLMGVATADLNLVNIQTFINTLKIGEYGAALLVDDKSNILASGLPELPAGKSLNKISSTINQVFQSNTSGQSSILLNSDEQLMLYQTIPQTNWKIAIFLPQDEINRPTVELLNWLLMISTVGIIIVIGSLLITNNGLIKEIKKVQKISKQMAEGNYSTQLSSDRKDEFGQMSIGFNQIIASTGLIIGRLQSQSNTIQEVSSQLNEGMSQTAEEAYQRVEELNEMRKGAETQLVATSESTIAMEEMAVGIQRIAGSVQEVSEATRDIEQKTHLGNERLNKVTEQIQSAQSAITQAEKTVSSLHERSTQIGSVIVIIQNISQQTKLLALNASIEAARAGEQGRGFAVVASEIGKLAEHVSVSAREITIQINSIQSETEAVLEHMQLGSIQVSDGLNILQEIEQRFYSIGSDIQRVVEEAQEVSSATEQMSAGSEEISASISQLSYIAKDAAQQADKVAKRSEEQLISIKALNQSVQSLTNVSDELNTVAARIQIS